MPVVNQVNFNPFAFRRALFDASQRHGVVLEAYSPLGTGRLLSDPAVGAIAARAGRTPAQVLLRWCVPNRVRRSRFWTRGWPRSGPGERVLSRIALPIGPSRAGRVLTQRSELGHVFTRGCGT